MAEHFHNNQVFTDDIPSLNEIEYSSIPKSYGLKSIIERLITMIIISSGLIITILFELFYFDLYMVLIYVGLTLWLLFWPLISVPKMLFAIREKDIIFKRGVFWHSKIIVPFSRIQHVDIKQGPLDRKFKLANLKVYTAGGNSGDLEINGLQVDNAEKIKQYIIEKIQLNV